MARAKRTERAAARRRYRAATDPAIFEADEALDEAPIGGRRAAPPTRPPAGGVVRMGIVAALRASIHPLRVRDDLAALPSLVTNKALWLPVLVTIASTVAVVATEGKNSITAILFAYFVQTPAIGGVFLAGFLAPRASWLLGVIVGSWQRWATSCRPGLAAQPAQSRQVRPRSRASPCPPSSCRRSWARCSPRRPPGIAAS